MKSIALAQISEYLNKKYNESEYSKEAYYINRSFQYCEINLVCIDKQTGETLARTVIPDRDLWDMNKFMNKLHEFVDIDKRLANTPLMKALRE
jgi:hypothetical protein